MSCEYSDKIAGSVVKEKRGGNHRSLKESIIKDATMVEAIRIVKK